MANLEHKQVDKFKNLTVAELVAMLERQKTLLANTKFIDKLPDKGEKIRSQKARLEEALAQISDVDDTAVLLQRLKLGRPKDRESQELDSDDDESPASDAPAGDKILGLQKDADSLAAKPGSKTSESQDPYAVKLTQRMEPESGRPAHLLYHFRPNRDLRTAKITSKEASKPWFETAVTPPPSKFDEAKPIPLKDSFELSRQHEETLKELAIAQLTEQLAAQVPVNLDAGFRETYNSQYREVALEDEDSYED